MEAQLSTVSRTLLSLLTIALLLTACGGGPSGDPTRGEELYLQPIIGESAAPGCTTCHSLEPDTVLVGPSHADVGARAEAIVSSDVYTGAATTAAEYLRESILSPDAYVADGFAPGVMYANYANVLTEGQVEDLVAFMLTRR